MGGKGRAKGRDFYVLIGEAMCVDTIRTFTRISYHEEYTRIMKKLERYPTEGTIAGVLAGFGHYFLVDVTVLRVLFVLLVLCTGFFPGVLAYIIAILIMPVQKTVVHEQSQA